MTLLYVHRLTISDAAGQRLIDGLSLHLEAGSTLGIAGGPGAGKMLLANALCGALPGGLAITGGRILVGNRDLAADPMLNDGVVAFGQAGQPLRAALVAIYIEGEAPPRRIPPDTGAIVMARSPRELPEHADDIAVLCGGRLVEHARAQRLKRLPRHPYTEALLADQAPAEPMTMLAGCPWRLACPHAEAACDDADMRPQMVWVDHATACRRWRSLWPLAGS